jgi:hypothetical protein
VRREFIDLRISGIRKDELSLSVEHGEAMGHMGESCLKPFVLKLEFLLAMSGTPL